MDTSPLLYAMIFIAVVALISSAVIMIAFNNVSGSRQARMRRKSNYRPGAAHRAFKDVL